MAQFDSEEGFYQDFEAHPAEFAAAADFADYCARVGGPLHELLATYKWAPAVFRTAKAGKRTVRALMLPEVQTFGELFAAVTLAETTGPGRRAVPKGGVYLSGSGSLCGHYGGRRGIVGGSRRHDGAKFYGTYVTPRDGAGLAGWGAFEAIRRTDGVLIVARDAGGIEGRWVALLDLGEDIETYFDARTKHFLESERAAAAHAWGGVAGDHPKG